MKRIFLIAVTVLFTFTTKAQVATIVELPELKDGDKLMNMLILDPGLDKQLVISSSYNSNPNLKGGLLGGATKNWSKYSIINTSDFNEAKDLGDWPKAGEEYVSLTLRNKNYYGPNRMGSLKFPKVGKSIFRVVKKCNKTKCEIFLQNLFSAEGNLKPLKPLFDVENWTAADSLEYYASKNEEYRVYNYWKRDKSSNTTYLKYWIYNNSYELVKKDSISMAYTKASDFKIYPYETGFAIVEFTGENIKVKINDLMAKKNYDFTISKGLKDYRILELRKLSNSKIVFVGDYFNKQSKRDWTYGLVKFSFDTDKSALEETINFDCIAQGKDDQYYSKVIYSYNISDNGVCNVLYAQGTLEGNVDKFEFVYFDKTNTSWKKQLPIPATMASSNPKMFVVNNNTYLTYMCKNGVKLDDAYFNNYTFGKPYPPSSTAQNNVFSESDLILLNISSTGKVAYKAFEYRYADQIIQKDNELIVLQKKGSPMGFVHKFFKLQFPK